MKTLMIRMPYIGGVLSENFYKRRNYNTKGVVKSWKALLTEHVEKGDLPKASRYQIGVKGFFKDERRPDISNLFKIISDAVQDGLQVNDKYFIMVDEGCVECSEREEVVITICPGTS